MMLLNDLTHQTIVRMIKRPIPRGMNKNLIALFKDQLGGKIMTEFVALNPNTYSYF